MYPFSSTSAQASPVPFNTVNTTTINDIIVSASQFAMQELKVFSTANTHYAAFVTGYFMVPQATALSTLLESSTDNMVNNAVGEFTVVCRVVMP